MGPLILGPPGSRTVVSLDILLKVFDVPIFISVLPCVKLHTVQIGPYSIPNAIFIFARCAIFTMFSPLPALELIPHPPAPPPHVHI
jgi:hypothetical protein